MADWHALTSQYADTGELTGNALDNVADWIGAGIDPGAQHHLHSVARARARRAVPAAADGHAHSLARARPHLQGAEGAAHRTRPVELGFLGYPLLQTADVAIYDAHVVPVGEDQVPHLELSREVVRRFNNFYGEVLVEPQPLLTPSRACPASTTGR